ncbi:hypothetical protein QZH41_012773, partial [Actinostola sp. cb2023]
DVAYGTKNLRMSSGEVIEIPNLVRTILSSRMVMLYQTYCKEINFEPLGRSTLFTILKVRTYVHIFDSCSQDWFAVASILENVASELTRTAPQLKEIYLRSDNAGCYHNASLLVSAPVIISKKGLTLRDYSFSEANSGKDVCDRKIAPLKAHIEIYLNE